jgi:predicted transcriptional regulator
MIEQTATIVAAFLKKNQVALTEIAPLITQVNAALSGLGQVPIEVPAERTPAVSVRRSVTPDQLICLDCGVGGKMLKRHLSTAHGLTPNDYRARWGLPSDYPMAAPNYTMRRSELAKQIGLGRGNTRGRRKTG